MTWTWHYVDGDGVWCGSEPATPVDVRAHLARAPERLRGRGWRVWRDRYGYLEVAPRGPRPRLRSPFPGPWSPGPISGLE